MPESARAVQERVKKQRADEGKSNARPIYRYTIPESLANGIEEVGLIQLTSNEELRATKRARNDAHSMVYELAKQSLIEVNGDPLKESDGSVDTAWKNMSPPVRSLVIMAYNKLHTPEEDDLSDFLKSQQVTVG